MLENIPKMHVVGSAVIVLIKRISFKNTSALKYLLPGQETAMHSYLMELGIILSRRILWSCEIDKVASTLEQASTSRPWAIKKVQNHQNRYNGIQIESELEFESMKRANVASSDATI